MSNDSTTPLSGRRCSGGFRGSKCFARTAFRATASTMLNELGYRPDVIERQLAHGERNKIHASYNHTSYLPERRKIMQDWADYVDNSQHALNVTLIIAEKARIEHAMSQ